jgi:hypothetical protein
MLLTASQKLKVKLASKFSTLPVIAAKIWRCYRILISLYFLLLLGSNLIAPPVVHVITNLELTS